LKEFIPPIWNEQFTRKELEDLTKLAYKRFYTRPLYIAERLLKVRSFGELRRKMKAGLKVLKI
jgi:hypothetical protein